jgi:hypothetical protein
MSGFGAQPQWLEMTDLKARSRRSALAGLCRTDFFALNQYEPSVLSFTRINPYFHLALAHPDPELFDNNFIRRKWITAKRKKWGVRIKSWTAS